MKIRSIPVGALCGAALLATQVLGQEPERPRPPGPPQEGRNPADMIKRSDANGDGKISKEEFVQARAKESEEGFGRMDANSDGVIDEAEIAQIGERMRAGMAGRGGPEGGRRPEGAPSPEQNAAMMDQAFGRMDQDGNGQLSKEEFAQGMAKMREMRGGEGPGRPPGGEGGFRRPPQQGGGEGAAPTRPPLEGEKPAPQGEKPAPTKPESN